jgi:phage regulator Rha-like protein
MNEFEIITVENDESFVTIGTLVKFSGNDEKPIKALIRKYIDKIEAKSCAFSKSSDPFKFPRLANGTNENSLDWSNITLNERQAMFLLTLMANSEQVVNFKDKLEEEFYKFKNKEVVTLSPLQLANQTLTIVAEALDKETKQKEKALKMLETAKIIEINQLVSDMDISVDEFCKIVSDKLDNVMLGRTTCYIIFREIGLVEKTSTRPTQRGMSLYLSYRKHDYGLSTRVFTDKANQLIKLMIKTLSENRNLNELLGNPLGDL